MRRGTDTQTAVTTIYFASATPHSKASLLTFKTKQFKSFATFPSWVVRGSGRVQEAGEISGSDRVKISVGQVGSQNLDPRATLDSRRHRLLGLCFVIADKPLPSSYVLKHRAELGEHHKRQS